MEFPTAVRDAASRDLGGFLDGAWPSKGDYGFAPGDERPDISLGEPFCVFGLTEDVAKRVRAGESVAQAATGVGEWIFPVAAGEAYRTCLGVRPVGDNWKAVYLGNPYLAGHLRELREEWQAPSGDGFVLLSSTDPRGFFYHVPNRGPGNLTPITLVALNGGMSLSPPADWGVLMSGDESLAKLEEHWASGGAVPPSGSGE